MRHQADLSDSIALSDSSDSSPRANSPNCDFSQTFPQTFPQTSPQTFPQTFPQPTKTSATRFCPEKGRILRTSKSKCQFIRKKAGFYGQTRGRVFQTDADCGLTDKLGLRFTDRHSLDFPDTCHLDFPDALHLNFPDTIYLTKRPKSGTTELPSQMARGGLTALGTRGRGPLSGRAWSAQRHLETRRDVVNRLRRHLVGSFAERHPANSPHGDFSQTFPQTFPQPTENISNSILSGERGRFTDK